MTTEEKAKAYDEALDKIRKLYAGANSTLIVTTKSLLEKIFPQLRESEEDENTINELCNIIVSNSKNGYFGGYYAGDLVQKLKSLRLQPKQEWSEDWREEDIQTRFAFYTYKDNPSVLYLSNVFVEETSRNHGFGTRILKAAEKVAEAIGAITICLKVKQYSPANAWYRKHGYGFVAFEDGYDWLEKNLEYLKPVKSAEWSEEDERYINGLIGLIEDMKVGISPKLRGVAADRCIAFLKSLRPQPHWKPSEKKKKETPDGADIGYGLETAIDILENGFTHYQTDDGEYERKQALDVLVLLLNETRKKEDAKLWSKDIIESIVTWTTEKLQLYSTKESTPYVEAVKNNAQKVLDWAKEQWPIYYGWKPSEEQLLQLRCVISGCPYDIEPLVSLEKQLKQL